MNALEHYIAERYGGADEDILQDISQQYLISLIRQEGQIVTQPWGFFSYKLQGDALIVLDIYTLPRARKQGYAWKTFEIIKETAEKASKYVIIGFSEHLGQNQQDGRGAMLAAGFKKAFTDDSRDVYVRGVY